MMEYLIRIIKALSVEAELPEHLITATITSEDTVETLGLDSLGAVSLIERLEAELGISLPDDFLDMADNIAGIARRLDALSQVGVEIAGTNAGSSPETIDYLRVPTQ
ncbi:MAG: acyl carrier protein [Chromatiales bacterium]